MSAKYILMNRKITLAQKEIGKIQVAKWVILFASIPTMVLFPIAVIAFFVMGSKQKHLKRVVADLEVAMINS